MMPIIKRIGIGVGLATLVVIGVAFLLPRTYAVSRTITATADVASIHALVGDLEQWPEWTPWVKSDPTIVVTFGNLTKGVGAHQSWTGDSGSGELTFTGSEPGSGITYDMNFDEGKYSSQGAIRYRAVGSATEIVWEMTGDNGYNPVSRYFGLMMDPMVGPMFEDGLNRLKLLVERTPAEAAATADSTSQL